MVTAPVLPLLIEPEQLQPWLADPGVLVVDLSDPAHYAAGHVVGAVAFAYAELVRGEPPALGLVPDTVRLKPKPVATGLDHSAACGGL